MRIPLSNRATTADDAAPGAAAIIAAFDRGGR
jgi:hypothetical protein